jgi:hypothetical protein
MTEAKHLGAEDERSSTRWDDSASDSSINIGATAVPWVVSAASKGVPDQHRHQGVAKG